MCLRVNVLKFFGGNKCVDMTSPRCVLMDCSDECVEVFQKNVLIRHLEEMC